VCITAACSRPDVSTVGASAPDAKAVRPAPSTVASADRAAARAPSRPPPRAPRSARAEPSARPIYPWMGEPEAPESDGSLVERFAPPEGFARVALAAGSFGAWLRTLPLTKRGTSVVSYRGGVILPADHPNLGAVVAIDVGTRDLQQCADSILRLHAEWLYANGRRDMSYRAANRAPMPFSRWARGERMVPEGNAFAWARSGRADASHASLRRYLDAVFTWANTGALARDTDRIDERDLAPGDFVVQAGAPGHAVLILDVARAPDGRRALLLGQGFMPAQSFHVLAPGDRAAASPWFVVEPSATSLATPFWAPFPWRALRRFPSA
jgi:hypothetical protein